MSKRYWMPLVAVCFSAATVFAAAQSDALNLLNAEIAKLLSGIQNQKTEAGLVFDDIRTNDTNALYVKLNAYLSKVGSKNSFAIRLNELKYDFNNGVKPTTTGKLAAELDLTKIVTTEQLNEVAADLEQAVKDFSKDYVQEYGEAVTISAKITDKQSDENGNVTSISGSVSFAFDLNKLPQDKKPEEILFTGGELSFAVDFKKSMSLTFMVESNTSYLAFQKDQMGLKNVLDSLLARDQDEMNSLQELFNNINSFAEDIAEGRY
jgi:hypothetical protein